MAEYGFGAAPLLMPEHHPRVAFRSSRPFCSHTLLLLPFLSLSLSLSLYGDDDDDDESALRPWMTRVMTTVLVGTNAPPTIATGATTAAMSKTQTCCLSDGAQWPQLRRGGQQRARGAGMPWQEPW